MKKRKFPPAENVAAETKLLLPPATFQVQLLSPGLKEKGDSLRNDGWTKGAQTYCLERSFSTKGMVQSSKNDK